MIGNLDKWLLLNNVLFCVLLPLPAREIIDFVEAALVKQNFAVQISSIL